MFLDTLFTLFPPFFLTLSPANMDLEIWGEMQDNIAEWGFFFTCYSCAVWTPHELISGFKSLANFLGLKCSLLLANTAVNPDVLLACCFSSCSPLDTNGSDMTLEKHSLEMLWSEIRAI